jgi:hypothetical protein
MPTNDVSSTFIAIVSTTPTSIYTPIDAITEYYINMTVRIPIPSDEFTLEKQDAFKNSFRFENVVGVIIVSFIDTTTLRRLHEENFKFIDAYFVVPFDI